MNIIEPDLIKPELSDEELLQSLNGETAQLSWRELESHFARGVVVRVAPELDLIDVAMRFTRDDHNSIEPLMGEGKIARASDGDAMRWSEQQPTFWAIVVAPWVLVQELEQT